ncbi:hypothetical protein P618_201098 [Holospora obtusa F1]|uniref:Uncharacterized protein n=1 Tax=Holospora obtusa F1 TaxID=1399147 RepID=W6TDQ6_HOLOB|nr:hypothetical protein [Holospora obtusa]ETZ06734.1 hypothetical protein P618_201098 [Holospora obtusa F1]
MKKKLILLFLFISQTSLPGLSANYKETAETCVESLKESIKSNNLLNFMRKLTNLKTIELMGGADWTEVIEFCISNDKKNFFEMILSSEVVQEMTAYHWKEVLSRLEDFSTEVDCVAFCSSMMKNAQIVEKFDGGCWSNVLLVYASKKDLDGFTQILKNKEVIKKMKGSDWNFLLDECIGINQQEFFKKILNHEKINEITEKLDGFPWKLIKYIKESTIRRFRKTMINQEYCTRISVRSINFVFNRVRPSPEVVEDFIKIIFKLKTFSYDDYIKFFKKNVTKINDAAIIKGISEIEGENFINRAFKFLKKKNANSVEMLLKDIQTIKTNILKSDITEKIEKKVNEMNLAFPNQNQPVSYFYWWADDEKFIELTKPVSYFFWEENEVELVDLRDSGSRFWWWRNACVAKYTNNLKAVNEVDKYIENIKKVTESVSVPSEQKETFLKGVYYVRTEQESNRKNFDTYLHLAILDTSVARAKEYKLKKMIEKEMNNFSSSYHAIKEQNEHKRHKLFNKYSLCIDEKFKKAYPNILEIDTSTTTHSMNIFKAIQKASIEKLADDVYKIQSCSLDLAKKQYSAPLKRVKNFLGGKVKTLTDFLTEITDKSKTISASDLRDPENPYFRILEFYNNSVSAGGLYPLDVPENSGYLKNAFEKGLSAYAMEIDAYYTIAQLEGLQIAPPKLHLEWSKIPKQD